MNKVTILAGPQNSGKTTQARELTKLKKSVWLFKICQDGYHEKQISYDTEIVVFDEINLRDIHCIADFAGKEFLTFRPHYCTGTITIKRPEILICTELDPNLLVALIDKKVEVEVINFQPLKHHHHVNTNYI